LVGELQWLWALNAGGLAGDRRRQAGAALASQTMRRML
jgi:hypothetical protein